MKAKRELIAWSGIGAILTLLLVPLIAFAIVPTPDGTDPGPCSITVYWDDSWTGCGDVQPDSERGSLMAAAGENAIAVMRGWRRRNPELIVSTFQDSSTVRSGAVEVRRKEFADLLRREMARTFNVDSMAVMIASDSIGETDSVLRTRYWLARSVRQGKGPISRQIGWVDYFESWTKVGGRWALEEIEEENELSWELGAEVSQSDQFPSRLGMSMSAESIWSRSMGRNEELDVGRATIAEEPVPLVMVQPTYPEFAREAQIQGRVLLAVLVSPAGTVTNIRVIKGVTGLNEAAMDAVRRWTFRPAFDHAGDPIEAWHEVPIDFHF